MPISGEWALSPLGIYAMVQTILADEAEVVLECGSGTSTIWFGMAVRESGVGHVWALEHDKRFLEKTRSEVARHGLDDFVSVLDAPLCPVDGESPDAGVWYSKEFLDRLSGPIDVLLVDGPPAGSEGQRDHVLSVVRDSLRPGAWIFVDDMVRPREKAMVANWLKAHPELERLPSPSPQIALLRWNVDQIRRA